MSKTLRIVFLVLLITAGALSLAVFSYADTIPDTASYTKCDIYVDGSRISQPATVYNGNVYIDIDTLQRYGTTDGWMFDEELEDIWIRVSDLDVFFGDEETTEFIKRNAGIIAVKLKYFSTGYDGTNRYYVSLGPVADLARLEWTYKDGAVYISPYSSFTGEFAVATGLEDTYRTEDGDERAGRLRENQLLRITGLTQERYRLSDTAGNTYFVPADQVRTVTGSSSVHSFSRQYRKKDVYGGPINAMWSDINYCPEKIDGLDVLADISFYPWASTDGSSYTACVNICDWGVIQTAHATGYRWWLCAQNFNTGIGSTFDYIDNMVKDRALAKELAAQYLFYSCIYDADGINIDYEEMDSSCRNYFISFMQTLGKHADKLGLTTSVCTYCGTVWNNATIYPYDIFGQCCDFICEMVYNEDVSSSLSPMSRPYYIAGTDYIGSLAPKERILMGVADYTRYTYWSGDTMVGSLWLTLNGVWSDQEGMTMTWGDWTGQYYCEQPYVRYGTEYLAKFYVEEARSSALKAQYIVDGGYGGTIGWMYNYMSLSFPEVRGIYDAYHRIYHCGASYEEFVP